MRKSYQVSGRCLPVLKGLSLNLADRGITVILGRSGCGKTTLLRLIAGLEPADSGEIEKVEKIGVIFQEPRLMPWLTVEKNILLGIDKEKQDKEKLSYLLELTGLTGFEKARPFQLSGGMQQRVALARALAHESQYLLMDEPFAALDYFTRAQMQRELLKIYHREEKGILFVTHSIEEALIIGTQIVIMENGVCERIYDLESVPFPRDLLSKEMVERKGELIRQIERQESNARADTALGSLLAEIKP